MSVVGIDVGNESGIVAVARQRGIDVVLNDESKRETPNMVSFGDRQRLLGVSAAGAAMMNPRNTVSQIKRLLGMRFADADVQRDLAQLPFAVVEGPGGEALVQVQYMGERRTFTPTALLGMVLSQLKAIGERNLGTKVVDCVIGVPVYLTDAQRRTYLEAAEIAGLHPLRLMHDTTAAALAYGIYKTDLPEADPIQVAFVDVGHSVMQVCVASFKKGQLKVLAHTFDRNLGGRDFDEVLFAHFADRFQDEYQMDVRSNPRASLRLRAACEKMKKMLSANPEAPLNIECLMDEKDVKGHMSRDVFLELSQPLMARVQEPCFRALHDAGITPDKLFAVEVVGSGSRVPAIMKALAEIFQREPSRTMNSSEAVARGCALQCAMLSPTFKVRDFEVQDVFPFSIALSWKSPSAEAGNKEPVSTEVVFPRGNSIPSSKLLTFIRSEQFTIEALYAEPSELPEGAPTKIGTFTVGPFQPSKPDVRPKLKVKVKLNLHGILVVESATLIEEEESAASKDGAPMDMDSKDESVMADGLREEAAAVESDTAQATQPAAPSENGVTPMDQGNDPATVKPEAAKKKKVRRVDVPVVAEVMGGYTPAELQNAVEKELEMALQDRVMEETKDRKNAVEAYVYDMRNKLYDKLQDYVTDAEKETLTSKLQETEDWLYEDGEDEKKSVYIARLADLKKLGDPIEQRRMEEELRGPALEQLTHSINSFREAATSSDAKYDHIDSGEKQKVLDECNKAEEWLKDKLQQQSGLPKTATPAVLSEDMRKKLETLDRFCKPIMLRSKPVVKAPPPPPPAADAKPKNGPEDASAAGDSTGPSPPPLQPQPASAAAEDAMDTDSLNRKADAPLDGKDDTMEP